MLLRWSLLLLMAGVMAEESPSTTPESGPVAAPAVFFRDLEWWGPDPTGWYGWRPGRDLSCFPPVMGRIEAIRVTGTQEMVWDHAFYRIDTVRQDDERTCRIAFEKGSLKLIHLEHRRWQVEFTPTGGLLPTLIFRTDRPAEGSCDPP